MKHKKYQVFISSTYTDLIEERKKVQEILLMAGCIPAGMEAFVAANDEQFEVIKRVIDLCDYYVLIIGRRYGSINATTGLSYTEMEYDYAVSQGIPVLVFAIDETVKLEPNKKETDKEIIEKLKLFRAKAMTNRLVSIWRNIGDLAGDVAVSVMKAQITIERPGWVRGDNSLEEGELKNKIIALQEENKELIAQNNKLKMYMSGTDNEAVNASFSKHIPVKFDRAYYTNNRGLEVITHEGEITLKDIFDYVSQYIEDTITLVKLKDLIAQAIGAANNSFIKDNNLTTRIIGELIDAKLLCEIGDGDAKVYRLTLLGIRLRDKFSSTKKRKA